MDFDNNLLNEGESVIIEDSVWICRNENRIVGIASVVTKKFNESNCVIAGNPAAIRKRNIKWNELRPKQYKYVNQKGE